MSTTNLNIENIFPTYELVDTVATKASITDALDFTGTADATAATSDIICSSYASVSSADTVDIPVNGGSSVQATGLNNASWTSNDDMATALASAIDLLTGVSASAYGAVVTVTQDTAGVYTGVITTNQAGRYSVAAFSSGSAAVRPSFTLNGVTITVVGVLGGGGNDEIQVVAANANVARNKIRMAINGTEDAAVGYGSNLDSAEGVDGVKSSDGGAAVKISLASETAGANSITLANVVQSAVTATGLSGATGTDAAGAININLSDLDITGNDLTVAEAQDDTGDYRKLIYHIVRKYQDYLASYEIVTNVVATGGVAYQTGDTLVFSGGSPTTAATGSVSSVDGSGNPTAFSFTAGKGYASAPTVTITSSTATTTATVTAIISDNTPSKLSVTKGALSENTTTGIISRDYTINIGFDEAGLSIATD